MVAGAESKPSNRTQECAAMIEEALGRPGVRDAMAVYDAWERIDKTLRDCRAATATAPNITTTDRTNEADQVRVAFGGQAIRSDGVGNGPA